MMTNYIKDGWYYNSSQFIFELFHDGKLWESLTLQLVLSKGFQKILDERQLKLLLKLYKLYIEDKNAKSNRTS